MKKKILLLFAVLASAINALAYDFQVDGIYYNTVSLQEFTCEVTKSEDGYFGDIVIPSTVTFNGKTFTVKSIGEWAFSGSPYMTSVIIGNSVQSISNYAFKGCTGLTSLTIGNSVNWIGNQAFNGCTGLTSIVIPNSVTSIGAAAFWSCINITSLELGNSVNYIEEQAFYKCIGLTSLVLPKSVTMIGEKAFSNCIGLTEITSLPHTPPSISSTTFEGVSKVEVLLKVPQEVVSVYQTTANWNSFWNIVGINDDNDDSKRCDEPTIELVDGELVATSTTEGAQCYISVTSEDIKCVYGEPISLTGIYNVSSYAYAEGYLNSESVTAIIVWMSPALEEAGILNMETKKAVLLRSGDGNILVSGTERGETIQIYTIDGLLYCTVSADEYQTVIPCNLNKGEVVIVSYGGKSVKIML